VFVLDVEVSCNMWHWSWHSVQTSHWHSIASW